MKTHATLGYLLLKNNPELNDDILQIAQELVSADLLGRTHIGLDFFDATISRTAAWVVTLPEARGRGLGEACTRLAGNRAFELGARCMILQASSHGEPTYLRMGYREITRYRWYVKGPPA